MFPHDRLGHLGCVHAGTSYGVPCRIIEAGFPHVLIRKYHMLKYHVVAGPSRSCCFPVMILDSEPDMIIPAGGQPGRVTLSALIIYFHHCRLRDDSHLEA